MSRPDRDPAERLWRRLDLVLCRVVIAGVLLVLCVPALRTGSHWLGAGALWLVAMPLSSWWALHRFRLPSRRDPRPARELPRRRHGAQARRRKPASPARLPRAA